MKKYIIEFIGTFFLVFVIGLTTKNIVEWQSGEATIFAPIAVGSILIVMVYMGYHISGAHYNPGVTLVMWIKKQLNSKEAIYYMLSQILGGLLAAIAIYLFFDQTMNAPEPYKGFTLNIKPILMEAIFTFALVIVVLTTAFSKKTEGNSYYGLAIGFTYMAAIFAAGPISGGVFNPAMAIGPTLIDVIVANGTMANLPIYIIGPLLGSLIAGYLFNYLEAE